MPDTATEVLADDGPVDPGDRPHRGRPRDGACDRAIEAAALDLLVEQGFAGLSIEGVAARAGVAKTTVYRRWDNKADLVIDAFLRSGGDQLASPDTGSVRRDLVEMLHGFLDMVQTRGDLVQALVAEQRRHPVLAETFRAAFLRNRQAAVREVLARGVARGEIAPDADMGLLADVGAALIWYRLSISGAPLDDDLPERIVAQFLPSPAEPVVSGVQRG
jgi:AcrR family transcriptional regulator